MERILNKLGTSLPYENVSYLLKDCIELNTLLTVSLKIQKPTPNN